jgi:hypothetical protein
LQSGIYGVVEAALAAQQPCQLELREVALVVPSGGTVILLEKLDGGGGVPQVGVFVCQAE